MNIRPPILSRRFFAVARAAFEASPRKGLAALRPLLSGKRLRAWNMLCVAAAESPHYYSRWIAAAEPAAIDRWCSSAGVPASPPASILALIVTGPAGPGSAFETSAARLRRAFGDAVDILAVPDGLTLGELETRIGLRSRDWILPIRAGDLVSAELGRVLACAISRSPDAEAWYWDEDQIGNDGRDDPWIKPAWDPLLFASHGGLLGAAAVRTASFLDACRGKTGTCPLDPEAMSGILGRINPQHICHVPLVLTHRGTPRPAARPLPPPAPARWPRVSIIIPMRDKPELLQACLQGLDALDYPGQVEVVIVDNGSTDSSALSLLIALEQRTNTVVLRMPGAFNFSRLNNAAVKAASGDMLCLLNNDIEPLDGTWLSTMVAHAVQSDVGAVGALLLYPDMTVQHAGVAIGLGLAAGHVQRGVALSCRQHWHWAFATRQVSAVTGACLVVARNKYCEVGGLDENAFAVAFNDVDFCLKLDRAGYRNLFVAEARHIHHESKSRGLDDEPEKAARFRQELGQLQARWQTAGYVDPRFSPVFSVASERCVLVL